MGLRSKIKEIIDVIRGSNKQLISASDGRGKTGKTRQTVSNEWMLSDAMLSRSYQEYHNKDLTDLSSWDHKNILKVLRCISPEVSHAITTYLRVFDSGYSLEVKKPNGTLHNEGKDALLKIINQIEETDITGFALPKSIRDLALKYALDCLFKGAIAGELVFDKRFNVQSIDYVDPWSIDFETDKDRWIPTQDQMGKIVVLDIPNFIYIPVDPLGDDPYGEEQLTSAIQPIIFKAMVMQDLRMAIHTNGWRRLNFKILEESILKNIPPQIKKDPKELKAFFQSTITDIIDTYKSLKPDDNIVHTDSIEVGALETAKGMMFDPQPLLVVIDNQISNALKTFQIVLSKKFGGGSEGFTSGEMVLYIKLVGGFQKIVESLFEKAFSLALRIQSGILADVNMKFYKPELRSDLELAQWRTQEIDNITTLYDEQAIGLIEKQTRLRELGQFDGALPDDLLEERRVSNGGDTNQPERPSSSEADKEKKRKETNRDRRSGR